MHRSRPNKPLQSAERRPKLKPKPSTPAPAAKHVKLKAPEEAKQVQKQRLADTQAKATEGRDNLGRFVKNNTYGKGNPFARQVQILRTAIYNSLDPYDVHSIVRALIRAAKRGNVHAAKLVLERSLGKLNDIDAALAAMVNQDEEDTDFIGNEKHI